MLILRYPLYLPAPLYLRTLWRYTNAVIIIIFLLLSLASCSAGGVNLDNYLFLTEVNKIINETISWVVVCRYSVVDSRHQRSCRRRRSFQATRRHVRGRRLATSLVAVIANRPRVTSFARWWRHRDHPSHVTARRMMLALTSPTGARYHGDHLCIFCIGILWWWLDTIAPLEQENAILLFVQWTCSNSCDSFILIYSCIIIILIIIKCIVALKLSVLVFCPPRKCGLADWLWQFFFFFVIIFFNIIIELRSS